MDHKSVIYKEGFRNGEKSSISVEPTSRTKEEMQSLLKQFKYVYHERLLEAQRKSGNPREKFQLQESILQSYISDLSEQNEFLVKTLGHLEEEINQKVILLEKSSINLQEYASMTLHFEEEMTALKNSKKEFELQCHKLEEEASLLRRQNDSLILDLKCLAHILKIARSTDRWEIKSLNLQNLTMEDLCFEDKSSSTVSKQNVKNLETQLQVESVIRPNRKMSADAILLGDHLSVRHHDRDHELTESSDPINNEASFKKVQLNLKQALIDKDILTKEITKKDEVIDCLQKDLERVLGEFRSIQNKYILSNSQDFEQDEQSNAESDVKSLTATKSDSSDNLTRVSHNCTPEKEMVTLHKTLEKVCKEKEELLNEVNDMSIHLNKLHISSEETRTVLTTEIADQHDLIKKLKEEISMLEDKYKEAVMTITHRGEVIKELRKEVKDASQKIEMFEETKTKLSQETINLKSQLEEQQIKINKIEETTEVQLQEKFNLIEDLQSQINESRKQQENRAQDHHRLLKKEEDIRKLKFQLDILNKENRSFANALIRRDSAIQNLESDLETVRQHYQETLEEVGRLNARLQSFTITAKNEQSLLAQELKCQEETVHRYHLDQMRLQDLNSQANEKISQQERTIENLQCQHKAALEEISEKEDVIQRLQQQISNVQRQNQSSSNEILQLRDSLDQINHEMQQLHNQVSKLQEQLTSRSEDLKYSEQNINMLQQQKREAFCKMSEQDTHIEKLESEIANLNLQLFKKTSEIETQQDALQRLEYSLTQSLNDVENERRKAEKEITSHEIQIKQLKEDLLESQRQHSACYDEVLHQDSVIEKTKTENTHLGQEIAAKQKQVLEFTDKVMHLELELSLSKERHKTCQKEVEQRDEEIIRQQAEHDTLQHLLQVMKNEVSSQKNENQRLQNRLTDTQMEMKQFKLQQEIYRQQIEDNKKITMEMETIKEQLDKKAFEQSKIILELKSQKNTSQLKFETELCLHKEEIRSQNKNIEDFKVKISDQESIIFNQKENLLSLRKEAAIYHKELEQVQKESQKLSDLLSHKEQGLKEEKERVINLEQEVQLAKTQLDLLEKNIMQQRTIQEELSSNSLNNLEKSLNNYREEIVEKNDKIVSLEEDLTNTHNQLEDSLNRINCVTTTMDHITQELTQTREELASKQKSTKQLEERLQQIQEHLSNKDIKIEEQEEVLERRDKEFLSYQKDHKHDNDLFDEMEHKVRELDAIIRSLQYLVEEKTKEKMELQLHLDQLQQEMTALKVERENLHIQSEKLQGQINEFEVQLQEENEKYNLEILEIKQKLKTEEENHSISLQKNKELEDQNVKQKKYHQRSEDELQAAKNNISAKVDEIEHLEKSMKILKDNLVKMKSLKCEANNETQLLQVQLHQIASEHQNTKEEQTKLIQLAAKQDEKIFLMGRTIKTLKDQLSSQRSINLELEHNQEKKQEDLEKLKEQIENLHKENDEQKELISEMNKDLVTMAEELQHGILMFQKYRNTIATLQIELQTSNELEKKLKDEIDGKFKDLIQLEELLYIEKDMCKKLKKDLENAHKFSEEVNTTNSELQNQMKCKETSLHETNLELKDVQEKLIKLQQSLTEKEQQMKTMEVQLITVEQNANRQNAQVSLFSESVTNFQQDLLEKEKNNQQNIMKLKERDNTILELKAQLASFQSNQSEVMAQLTEQSKQIVKFKLELNQASNQNEALMRELSVMETTLAHIKNQLQTTQEYANKKELEISLLSRKCEDSCKKLDHTGNQLKCSLLEISQQEEKLLQLHVELNQINNKYQQKLDEQNQLEKQISEAQKKMICLEKEVNTSQTALEDAKSSAERLRQESHQVATSFNNWISDQKNNSELMNKKICEQQIEINQLIDQKQKVLENNHILRKMNHRLKEKLEEQKMEFQTLKNLSESSSCPNYEKKHNPNSLNETVGKNNMVCDLLQRLRSNVDSIVQLNHQLSTIQREKVHLEDKLKQEIITRKTLESKLELKEQTIATLQTNLSITQLRSGLHHKESSPDVTAINSSLTVSDLKDSKVSNSDIHEYWMKQAKDLSTELQQSSKYWSHKVQELTSKLNSRKNNVDLKHNTLY